MLSIIIVYVITYVIMWIIHNNTSPIQAWTCASPLRCRTRARLLERTCIIMIIISIIITIAIIIIIVITLLVIIGATRKSYTT